MAKAKEPTVEVVEQVEVIEAVKAVNDNSELNKDGFKKNATLTQEEYFNFIAKSRNK